MTHAPADMHPYITLEDITLRVGDQAMFTHTSWTMYADQHWAIIGPNGSGKSILANAVCRSVPVIEGRILYYFDADAHGLPEVRPYFTRGEVVKISTDTQKDLLQTYGAYHQARWQSFEGTGSPTVSELLTGKSVEHVSPYEITPLRTDDSVYQTRRQHAIELLGIEYLLDRKILHISHGEGRKVLLARALMQVPKLLILDDPFYGLDTASRRHFLDILDGILEIGAFQVLLIASRVEEIPQNISHVLKVENHQIKLIGTKEHVLSLMEQPADSPSGSSAVRTDLFHVSGSPAGEPQTAALIEMRETSVSYGDVQVLQNITWTMQPGEHWAIVGPNGAGKTTLLSLILADNPRAYANNIRLFGRQRGSGESIWDIKRRIGWVSPELQMYQHVRTRCENVVRSGFFDSIGLYRTCSSAQAELAQSWMQALGIGHLRAHPFGSVSAGEQRLILLARALVKSPLLLVLDEPCQGLDLHHRPHILRTLDLLCRHTAVHLIYVTHYLDEIPDSISHVLELADGCIHQAGARHS